jgi:hypothetical protein
VIRPIRTPRTKRLAIGSWGMRRERDPSAKRKKTDEVKPVKK